MYVILEMEIFIISLFSFPIGGGTLNLLYPSNTLIVFQPSSSDPSFQSSFPSHLLSMVTQLPSLQVNSSLLHPVRVNILNRRIYILFRLFKLK